MKIKPPAFFAEGMTYLKADHSHARHNLLGIAYKTDKGIRFGHNEPVRIKVVGSVDNQVDSSTVWNLMVELPEVADADWVFAISGKLKGAYGRNEYTGSFHERFEPNVIQQSENQTLNVFSSRSLPQSCRAFNLKWQPQIHRHRNTYASWGLVFPKASVEMHSIFPPEESPSLNGLMDYKWIDHFRLHLDIKGNMSEKVTNQSRLEKYDTDMRMKVNRDSSLSLTPSHKEWKILHEEGYEDCSIGIHQIYSNPLQEEIDQFESNKLNIYLGLSISVLLAAVFLLISETISWVIERSYRGKSTPAGPTSPQDAAATG